jgi:hypothetical protein
MSTRYYAVAADFEPKGSLRDFIMNAVADKIFGNEKNDLLVPTLGVYQGIAAAGFPIPEKQTLMYPASKGVAHSFYFVQPETSTKLKEWLLAGG